ncbi:MAG: cation transporter [Myxococcales bacterium]|nr:cation transporter [Myxococcales bacterium]
MSGGPGEVSGLPGNRAAERALAIALGLNLGFLFIEVAVGILADSLALLSDAGHMVADVAALAFALAAQRLSQARPGGGYTFGLRRMPVLGAFGNALMLIFIAGFILWEAARRLQAPPDVAPWPVLLAGIAGLLVNLGSALLLHRAASRSLNVRGAVLHLLADALGSLGAMAVAVMLLLTDWRPIDALVSAGIALLILGATWPLLRDSARVLLQGAPPALPMARLRAALAAVPEVRSILDLHVWEIDRGMTVLSAALVTGECDLRILERVTDGLRQRLLQEYGIGHATFEWRTPDGCRQGCEDVTTGRPAGTESA